MCVTLALGFCNLSVGKDVAGHRQGPFTSSKSLKCQNKYSSKLLLCFNYGMLKFMLTIAL
jgi:hypothetical protein